MLRMWCAVALAIAGCTTVRTPSGQPSQAVQTASPATETAERWIRVSKAERMLYLYEGWQVVKSYPVVFGKDPVPAKLYEGDNRTPEGDYVFLDRFCFLAARKLLFFLCESARTNSGNSFNSRN